MSSFLLIKLDIITTLRHAVLMPNPKDGTKRTRRVATCVRERIERGGERLWRLEDFRGLPFAAVAQALSRLTRAGQLRRISKGTYYRSRQTSMGVSRPNPAAIRRLAERHRRVFPAGVAAANLLGFTSQIANRPEVATSASSLPRKLVGTDTVVHARRPAAWKKISDTDAALLDFLRHPSRNSELSVSETVQRTLHLLKMDNRLRRLLAVVATEPPRVRALLGALAEQLGVNGKRLGQLRASLNPLSRFEFGVFVAMSNARAWQAKGVRP